MDIPAEIKFDLMVSEFRISTGKRELKNKDSLNSHGPGFDHSLETENNCHKSNKLM